MNTKRLRKLCEELRWGKYTIKSQNGSHKVYYKRVIVVDSPESNIAEYIVKEYGALNARIADNIEGIIERTEANAKQELLTLNFGGESGTDSPD